jgi:hypothetical protein
MSMPPTNEWKFERVWTVGNVVSVLSTFISLLVMVGGLIGVYQNIRDLQTKQEIRLTFLEKQVEALAILGTSVAKAQNQIENLNAAVKLSTENAQKAVEQLTQIRIDIAQIRALYQSQIPPNRGPEGR